MSYSPQPLAPGEFFAYFSAIEQRFTARRGSILLLSTLDWALIETWREAGVPLEAVLRGIDESFDRHDARTQRAASGRSRLRKVNGLAWCAQAVMEAAEQIVDASTGLAANTRREPSDSGFEAARIANHLRRNADLVEHARARKQGEEQLLTASSLAQVLATTAKRLRELASALQRPEAPPLEELDRTLTLLEDRLIASLRSSATEAELSAQDQAADHELGSSRARLGAVQSRRVKEQIVQKRLLESYGLPRLSLFYMGLGE